jgi:hypothetical protein
MEISRAPTASWRFDSYHWSTRNGLVQEHAETIHYRGINLSDAENASNSGALAGVRNV